MNNDHIRFAPIDFGNLTSQQLFPITTITQIVSHFSSRCRIKMKNMLIRNDRASMVAQWLKIGRAHV